MSFAKETNAKDAKVTAFLVSHNRVFIGIIAVLAAGIIVFAIGDSVSRNNAEKAFMSIITISDDLAKVDSSDEAAVFAAKAKAVEDLTNLASHTSGFPATKAYMLAAEIEFSNKNWTEAASAFEAAFNKSPKSYTAPICLYNAAVAVEESGNVDKAADLYQQCSELPDFPLMSKVLFSCARIAEQQGKFDDAIALYNQIADEYPSSSWATLAKGRLIALKLGA